MSAIIKREAKLFAGEREHIEYGPFKIVLYWEPHYDTNKKLLKSFTVDVVTDFPMTPATAAYGVSRWRFARLTQADAHIATLKDELAVDIAKIAMRLN